MSGFIPPEFPLASPASMFSTLAESTPEAMRGLRDAVTWCAAHHTPVLIRASYGYLEGQGLRSNISSAASRVRRLSSTCQMPTWARSLLLYIDCERMDGDVQVWDSTRTTLLTSATFSVPSRATELVSFSVGSVELDLLVELHIRQRTTGSTTSDQAALYHIAGVAVPASWADLPQ